MKPKPWSHTALDQFVTCPRQYYEVRIARSVSEPKTEQQLWGERVHSAFEERQRDGLVLPDEMAEHESYMMRLQTWPGTTTIEEKIGLNTRAQPCEFFAGDVWYRGVIDHKKVDGIRALLVDYKTGKVKNNFKQLKLFALHTFAAHPEVRIIKADYYWTVTQQTSGEVYTRDMIPNLWAQFIPDLKQYAQAFKTDTWQPRPSGLCAGWCPVTSCEFWRARKLPR